MPPDRSVPTGSRRLPRPLARATPIVLDHGRIAVTVPAFRSERSGGPGGVDHPDGPRLRPDRPRQAVGWQLAGRHRRRVGQPTRDRQPERVHQDGPSVDRRDRRASAGASAAAASAGPGSSASPGATAKPATKTYKVKAGDTLIGIAAKFGTTPKAIAKLNGITNTANLHVGQILKIP